MALVEVASQLSGSPATFICETPENSLDLAYADNVGDMFSHFGKADCYSLMTANLQAGGVAEPLLRSLRTPADRKRRVFNLLEHVELSAVQKRKLGNLNRQLRRLIS
jgi:hypothetical protein